MVFSGKLSRACKPCRDKRRKCDVKQPQCSTCMRMGIRCYGYRDTQAVSIKDQTSAVVLKEQRRKGIIEKQSSKTDHSSHKFRQPQQNHQQDNAENVCLGISYPPEQLALAYFLNVFSQAGLFQYLPLHISALAKHEDIVQAMYAPALASLATEHRSGDLMRTARLQYSKALAQTNNDLSDPQAVALDKTLLRVLLLSSFEALVFEGRRSPQEWALHVQGSSRLLVLRGTKQFETEVGRQLFHHASVNVLTNCVMQELAVPDDFLRLQEYAISGASGLDNNRIHIISFLTRFASLRVNSQGMLATQVVREALDLDALGAKMLDKLHKGAPYQVINVLTDDYKSIESGVKVCTYKGTMHKYQSQQSARIYNTLWLIRLMMKEWIFCAFDHSLQGVTLDQPEEDDPLHEDWDQMPIRAALQASDIIDDMLASVPYSIELLELPFSPAARSLVWPLVTAASSEVCPPAARLYIIDRLKALAKKFSLNQALHAARMLEERVPLEDWTHLLHLS